MLNEIRSGLRPALVLTLLFAALLGLAYPALITGIGRIAFPWQASGSLVRDARGVAIGSAIIGQQFASPGYFHGRPSAAGKGYDALASSGSNYGPAAKPLADRISATLASPDALAPPADLVTASASGLDPDLSPEAALYQAPRVAAARHVDPAKVRALVDRHTARPLLGFIGEPRVNVLALNRALDAAAPRP
ncbi:potassium-transporting ATPase subunit KdpC [Sphingomonas sp. CL5.1]|uniref:potassium-transporting ATPase subunit KdpC n=1 Tax=Sphingomonas sp. CL5.1 TaxID=2653203 RepID=UPI001581D647|nr:potassium-transporting ATPase subunit KdpC [Sphingomonas sp. CL5.1]QKS00499.1 potassium-transporting ATPase subunit KdpC [Sphingomonas sp. CL5.1]